ncbi:MAG TPA: ATP-binding cassette domain-containing protein [Acidimicrobiia bacterium]
MLKVDSLAKSYGDVVALDSCTFEAKRGRMMGFLGPNGSGKTTTMRSIFGLVRPDRGTVSWDGQPVDDSMRIGFGYMPEQRGLYPRMKILDQVAYMGRIHGMTKPEALDAANSWLGRLGLEDRKGHPLESLSHGNQQRVQLAVALVHDPQLLVLDEPFSGLDPIAAETMSEILSEEAARGKAVVFSSHQLDVVEDLCEDVVIINDGRIVVEGVVKDLKDAAPIRHLEIELDESTEELLNSLDGVVHVSTKGDTQTAIIDARTDVRGVLMKAQEAGTIRHFTYTSPSLSDLFREAVK